MPSAANKFLFNLLLVWLNFSCRLLRLRGAKQKLRVSLAPCAGPLWAPRARLLAPDQNQTARSPEAKPTPRRAAPPSAQTRNEGSGTRKRRGGTPVREGARCAMPPADRPPSAPPPPLLRPKSRLLAYALWLVGGWWGCHLLYLARDTQAILCQKHTAHGKGRAHSPVAPRVLAAEQYSRPSLCVWCGLLPVQTRPAAAASCSAG
jgi:hypothetical protein